MIHELIPWRTLTRASIPPLKVVRRPLVLGEVTIPVGATLDPEVLPPQVRKERLRQFYEARLLEPVDAPTNSRQFYREQLERSQGLEPPIAPITPVAAAIVAGLPSVDAPPVASFKPKPKSKSRPKGRR